tara:strand:- start:612 stop:1421 length:810 start_codon:yes stop_codon:yes gene_type:complete
MVITILGASGFLGNSFYKSVKKLYETETINLRNIDLSIDENKLINLFRKKFAKSNYIINFCASLKPKSKSDIFINSKLPKIIQKAVFKTKKKPHFIHISTLNIFIDKRTDDYTILKKIGEKNLNTKYTTIVRLPFVLENINVNKNKSNIKILNDYLNISFFPFYPMIYPGHIYKPISTQDLNKFLIKLIRKRRKLSSYNLTGKNKLSMFNIFEKLSKIKRKRIIKINTSFFNKISDKVNKSRIIRNNNLLSQIFYIDQTKINKVTFTKL